MNRLTKKVGNEDRYIASNFKKEKGESLLEACTNYSAKVINKLGKLEDIFELMDQMQTRDVLYKLDNGEVVSKSYLDSTILYNPKLNKIEIYNYEFNSMYDIEEFGKSWWLK